MTGRGLRYGGHWNLRNNISDEFQILDFETSFAGSFIAVVEEIVNIYFMLTSMRRGLFQAKLPPSDRYVQISCSLPWDNI